MKALAQVLRALPQFDDPNLIVGPHSVDDAGVYRLSETLALVLTVDFFPPVVDDPFDYGGIAAANSLSDCYAKGARPLAALNCVGFPTDELPIDVLTEILRGGAEKVKEAGAVIAGGHTQTDRELKYGLAVVATVHPDVLVTNSNARPGDSLVLTKPLGTGVLTTALQAGKLPEPERKRMVSSMLELNARASEKMLELGAHAATDVTGYGLLGHAATVARESDVTAEIDAKAVRLLPGAREFCEKGFLPAGSHRNREAMEAEMETEGADDVLVDLLCDAQTSGGLLVSLGPAEAEGFCRALPEAHAVGRVVARTGKPVRVKGS